MKNKFIPLFQLAIGLSIIVYAVFSGNKSVMSSIVLGAVLCFLGINRLLKIKKDAAQTNAVVKVPLVLLLALLVALVLNFAFAYYKTDQKSEQMRKIEQQLQSERSK